MPTGLATMRSPKSWPLMILGLFQVIRPYPSSLSLISHNWTITSFHQVIENRKKRVFVQTCIVPPGHYDGIVSAKRVRREYSKTNWLRSFGFNCFQGSRQKTSPVDGLDPSRWIVDYAPPPDDIEWQNLHITNTSRNIKSLILNVFLLLFVLLVFAILIKVFKSLADDLFKPFTDLEKAAEEGSFWTDFFSIKEWAGYSALFLTGRVTYSLKAFTIQNLVASIFAFRMEGLAISRFFSPSWDVLLFCIAIKLQDILSYSSQPFLKH